MQGLCSYGFACRMAIGEVIPEEPERMTRMSAQMRNVCYPDSNIILKMWKIGEGKLVFQLVDAVTRKPILDKGEFDYK